MGLFVMIGGWLVYIYHTKSILVIPKEISDCYIAQGAIKIPRGYPVFDIPKIDIEVN
jgi:hypothetical protein